MAYRLKKNAPQSPFLSIFQWPVTMITSIVHRVTGIGLAGGLLLLAWWLFSVSTGPEAYAAFYRRLVSPLGQVCVYGFVWAYSYHFLNGIRHLFWDFGYGFALKDAKRSGLLVIALSLVLTAAVFVALQCNLTGYYDEP